MPIRGAGGGGSIATLSDVVLTGLATNDILRYNGTNWVNVGSLTDWLSQYLLLAGRTGGQRIGTGTHGSGTTNDLVIEGRLNILNAGTTTAFITGRALNVGMSLANNSTFVSFIPLINFPTGAASGNLTILASQTPSAMAYTSGTLALLQGFSFLAAGSIAATSTASCTTDGTTTLTSSGLFVTPIAVGSRISGTGIPLGTVVTAIANSSSLTMSMAATDSTTATRTFTHKVIATLARGALLSATPSEVNMNLGGRVAAYLGAEVVAEGTSIPASLTIVCTTDGTDNLVCDTAGGFVSPIAVGQVISGTGIPAGTTVLAIVDTENITMSNAAGPDASIDVTFVGFTDSIRPLRLTASARSKPATLGQMIVFASSGSADLVPISTVALIDFESLPFNPAVGLVGTYSFLRNSLTASNPTVAWMFDITGTNNSRHAGKFSIGTTSTPTAWLLLGAGTTTVAPLKLTSGTNLTSPGVGAVEYDGSYFYLTHSDAVRTKVVTQRGAVNATGQTAGIGATTIYTPPAAGYYLVHYTLEVTAFTAGTIQFQENHTDDIGATNQVGAALGAIGRDRGVFQVYSASGAIAYQTNAVGFTGTYTLRVRVVALG